MAGWIAIRTCCVIVGGIVLAAVPAVADWSIPGVPLGDSGAGFVPSAAKARPVEGIHPIPAERPIPDAVHSAVSSAAKAGRRVGFPISVPTMSSSAATFPPDVAHAAAIDRLIRSVVMSGR